MSTPGVQPPPLWGADRHVLELFGDRVEAELDAELDALTADADEGSGRMHWEYVGVTGRRR